MDWGGVMGEGEKKEMLGECTFCLVGSGSVLVGVSGGVWHW